MFNNSQVKLMDRPERDVFGKPTGNYRTRPTYDVMVDPLVMTPELESYRHTPQYIDEVWAGQETVYLRFITEAQARSMLARHLAER